MPTLLQINTVVNRGSTGRIAEDIGKVVMANGWNSYITYGRYIRPSQSNLVRIGTQCDVYKHVLQTRLFDKHGLCSERATEKLVSDINIIKPDIIHLHNIHGYYLNYPILFRFLGEYGAPVVWTLHDCWTFTGHCANFSFVGCNKWKNCCYDCIQKRCYPASLWDGSKRNYLLKKKYFTLVENMVLVPVSTWLRVLLSDSFLSCYPTRRIYNGVDVDVFRPVSIEKWIYEKGFCGKRMVLGVANNWDNRKGLKDFLELRKILFSDYIVVLVGLKDKQIKSLPEGIIGIKRTDSVEELAMYYSAASVFVNPTWEDNFPTVNLEALACGTPVITYRTGGSVEAVTDETGLVVEQGDIQGLARAIYEMSSKDRKKLEIVCRKRVLDCFNKDDRYSDYLNLYNNLLLNTTI